MFYKQLSNSYGPISPQKTLLKCSCFDGKPAEITYSCEVPGYPAVKLSSTNFRQIFLAVLPGKGHSGSMTLLKVVLCWENDRFSQPPDWIEVSKCWTLTFWHLRNNSEKMIQQTLPSLRSHIMNAYGFTVTCNVTLKCYVTAETSPGNYARSAVWTSLWWEMFETYFVIAFLGSKARNWEIRFYTFHFLSRIWICWSDLFGIYIFSVILWVK